MRRSVWEEVEEAAEEKNTESIYIEMIKKRIDGECEKIKEDVKYEWRA